MKLLRPEGRGTSALSGRNLTIGQENTCPGKNHHPREALAACRRSFSRAMRNMYGRKRML